MATSLLSRFAVSPPLSPHTHPSAALSLSQSSAPFLKSGSGDTPETWLLYENLFYTFLRTRDDDSAKLCLQRLTDRFGATNERIMGLAALYDEATAHGKQDLEALIKRYEDVVNEDPTNIPIFKRLISVLIHLAQPQVAISNLTTLLSTNPTDAESWAELSQLYFSLSLYPQAIFCLEEVLLIYPNAYNIYARLGEISYISSSMPTPASTSSGTSSSGSTEGVLLDSLRCYLRSVELCEDYLRGYYGLVLVTRSILREVGKVPQGITREKVEGIQRMAVSKLGNIVARARRKEKGWCGYDDGEVEAAGKLLEEVEGEKAPK